MLPHAHDHPARRGEPSIVAPIAVFVALELLAPVRAVVTGLTAVNQVAAVPEAAVDEDGDPKTAERDVRPYGAAYTRPVTRVQRDPSRTSLASRAPAASSARVRAAMQATRRRDTPAEVALRRALHRRGLRYRVDLQVVRGLRRRADIVFGPAKVAVFVDGCYWHGCPTHGELPMRNRGWWREKLEANMRRDTETTARLEAAGWHVVRVWEHEDPEDAAHRIATVVRYRRRGSG